MSVSILCFFLACSENWLLDLLYDLPNRDRFGIVDHRCLHLVDDADLAGAYGARLAVPEVFVGDGIGVVESLLDLGVDLEEDGGVGVRAGPAFSLRPLEGPVLDPAGGDRAGEAAVVEESALRSRRVLHRSHLVGVVKRGLELLDGVVVSARGVSDGHRAIEGDALSGSSGFCWLVERSGVDGIVTVIVIAVHRIGKGDIVLDQGSHDCVG